MKITADEFPLVRMDYSAEPTTPVDSILITITLLLEKRIPFVFVCTGSPVSDNNESESIDDRRKISRWMKENKTAVSSLIKGHIHIMPDDNKRTELESFSVTFERFWGYPMFPVATEDEARVRAEALLRG